MLELRAYGCFPPLELWNLRGLVRSLKCVPSLFVACLRGRIHSVHVRGPVLPFNSAWSFAEHVRGALEILASDFKPITRFDKVLLGLPLELPTDLGRAHELGGAENLSGSFQFLLSPGHICRGPTFRSKLARASRGTVFWLTSENGAS
jgi:hypothetical protein